MLDDPRPSGPTLVHVPAPHLGGRERSSAGLRAARPAPAVTHARPRSRVEHLECRHPDDQQCHELHDVDRFVDQAIGATWEEIAERYGHTVFAMAYRLTGDQDEARDLAQDVFVRVYRNLERYRPGTFEGWLYRITKNLFLDRVRRRARVRMEPLPDEEWRQPPESGPGPAERAEADVLRDDLELALQGLAPSFRTAVVLCDVQGLSYEEIATTTGWPIGTVRSRIHRGRGMLRNSLADRAGG